jgi:hypothetical protein
MTRSITQQRKLPAVLATHIIETKARHFRPQKFSSRIADTP